MGRDPPGEVPLPRLVAAWERLDLVPAERMPLWAAHWLADGYDGAALRTLAGLGATDDPRVIRDVLAGALADCGVVVPDSVSAAAQLAFISAGVVRRLNELTPDGSTVPRGRQPQPRA